MDSDGDEEDDDDDDDGKALGVCVQRLSCHQSLIIFLISKKEQMMI